jgi:homoserine dehydrogenase
VLGKKKVVVGIIGFGTVGSGTVKVLLKNRKVLKKRLGFDIKLKYVADLDLKTDRGVRLPKGVLIKDALRVINDPEVDIVVELIGGMGPAKDLIIKSIRQGKHVVTANKALLAVKGNEIFQEASANDVKVGFEASVAGGIPIIKVIRESLIANNILSVYGIINGTANYILSKMTNEGGEFKEALKEAQALGYAEADPTFDVEGVDAAHKLALLSSVSFGMPLSFDRVYTEGISGISSMDIQFAGELGYKIKLLAITKCKGSEVEMRVHPTMLPVDALISKVDGVFNAVFVRGDAVGDTLYYGRGAGDMPTASAVVADIADIARSITLEANDSSEFIRDTSMKVKKIDDVRSRYYFRVSALDKPGVLSRISGILGENDISIASVLQKGRKLGKAVPVVMLTHIAREKDIRRALKKIDRLSIVDGKTKYIRIEGEDQ